MATHAAARERRNLLRLVVSGIGVLAVGVHPRRVKAQTGPGLPPKIGMIGSGREGGALGSLWVKAGLPVLFSSRNPDRLKELAAGLGPLARTGTVEEAVAFGDVVVLAVPYGALEEIGKRHASALAKKTLVMDVCNPIAWRDGEALVTWVAEQGGPGVVTPRWLPGARIVRAFNAIAAGRLASIARPGLGSGPRIGVPIAGDDHTALAAAEYLVGVIGFEPVIVGGLAMGKHLVPGTPLAGEHSAAEIRRIARTLGGSPP
jgi:predicted dinucleotide-binding enzyme